MNLSYFIVFPTTNKDEVANPNSNIIKYLMETEKRSDFFPTGEVFVKPTRLQMVETVFCFIAGKR